MAMAEEGGTVPEGRASGATFASGTLYVVATPIGNLGDMTMRAVEALKAADCIAAEDTRVTRTLLQHLGISRTLLSIREHNETAAAKGVIERLARGERGQVPGVEGGERVQGDPRCVVEAEGVSTTDGGW